MITTIIDADGNEFVYGEPNAVALPRKGQYDRDVACYRNREWILTTISRLQVGDAFRFLDGNDLFPDRVFLVTSPPKVVPHLIKHRDPDILLRGITMQRLQVMYETVGLPIRFRNGLSYSPNLLRIPHE